MIVDLRSDTFTKPSSGMRKAMYKAEVGDDVFNEDPTVNKLQNKVSKLLGTEDGLYVSSGTMGNQIAINTHTQPGQEVILEQYAHIFYYEAGAPALLSGVQLRPVLGNNGILSADSIKKVIRPDNYHFPPTSLICIENTHNRAGGRIYPLEEIMKIRKVADEYNIKMHLDGARLWNASVASKVSLREYAKYFDSVSVCFSKGLGAPVGSMLLGNKEFIKLAHRYRKIYGGAMRQAGIIAAGALFAVENNIERLVEDHKNAKNLAEGVNLLPQFSVDYDSDCTNIVMIDVIDTDISAEDVVFQLNKNNVKLLAVSPKKIRAVTHLDVSREGIDMALKAFKNFSRKGI